jgi:hypothetical protein
LRVWCGEEVVGLEQGLERARCSGRRNGALKETTGAGAVQMERESERMRACKRGGDVDEGEERPK